MPSESLPEKPGYVIHVFQNRHGLWFAECKHWRGHGIFQASERTKHKLVAWVSRYLQVNPSDPDAAKKSFVQHKFIYYAPGELPPYMSKDTC